MAGAFSYDKEQRICRKENLLELMDIIFDPLEERLDVINDRLSLIQKKNGLTFGTDAYILSAFARPYPNGKAADLGCGTGVISLLCASRNKYSRIYAVEIQEEFASLTARNFELNGLSDKLTVINKNVDSINQGDTCGELDAVLMNPPYMKNNSGKGNEHQSKNIARREVCGTIYDFCAAAGRLLKTGGGLYAVYRPERLIDLSDAMRKSNIEPKKIVFVYPDTKSEPSLVLVEGKKGASPSLTVTRPLVIYKDGTREYTDDMSRIYEEFSLNHITQR